MELLEAANSILGSFQTLADGLDNPPKPRGWQTKRPVRTMKYALNRHSLDFKENIDSLLGPFADSDSALANLCEDLRNVKWKDTELAAAVDREYARSHERIQDTLERMQALLDKIQGRVGGNELSLDKENHMAESMTSDGNSKQSVTELETSSQLSTADPFISTASIEAKKQILDQFGRCNEELKGLVCPETAWLPPARTLPIRQGATHIHKPILHFWNHAKTLYEFISKCWRCKCHPLHQTNLLLQHRENQEVEFNVLFIFGGDAMETVPPWTWQDITLRPLEFTEKEQPLLDLKPQKIPEQRPVSPVADSSPSPSLALPTKRKVAFSGFDSTGHDDQQGDDLCQAFINHSHQQKWVQEMNCGRALYKLSQGLNIMERRCATREKKTLGNLLDSGHLNRPECCLIALVLASSVYQLHSSPWLQTSWDNRKIVFFSSFTDSSKILMDKPFLSGDHFHPDAKDSLSVTYGPGDLVVESLGIALLELCFGKTLETFPEYKDMGNVKPSHSFSRGFATDLLPRAYKQLGSEFADAIAWCLAHRQLNLEDESWRNELFNNVIVPLYEVYIANPLMRDGTSLINKGIIHNGDISNGGVGNYGTIRLDGGTNYIGGTHITHVYASKVQQGEQVSVEATRVSVQG
ncbi:hypothetical protein L207DRAFT_578504 [Hyaloscypha variabilis F]|uniref:DUF7580 domain-containing protein n=1 Tax=Hyaloscypha variabilis (strain UAMH 11265 / GT02V1 / F) TaxID=1149755 RepID=A0A2J6S4A9_HYAVF|nr:hypothetical protein L207DRAFT_578504 [Hyaloscypha variabilis F]